MMKARDLRRLRRDLEDFVESMTKGLGRLERRHALGEYIRGLLLDGERKSTVPIAERLTSADDVQGLRQRMQQAVTVANWDEAVLFERVAEQLTAKLPGVEAFIIDDTGFPKKGRHSVGVTRQYSGTLGRTDNCQVATSLHLAGAQGSGCIGMRLYLPQEWADDKARREKTGVPEAVQFQTKLELSLELLDKAVSWGLPRYVVLADSGYGDSTDFRQQLEERGLTYLVAVSGQLVVWPPGCTPTVPPYQGRGRPPAQYRHGSIRPCAMEKMVHQTAFRKVTWSEGPKGPKHGQFAALRVRTAHGWTKSKPPGEEQWLLIEKTRLAKTPYKFYLSSLPPDTSLKRLVSLAKLRWRVERDYQEMKGELGLDHFEGRGWVGFHHHAALCSAAHAFLVLRRALFPPDIHSVDALSGTA